MGGGGGKSITESRTLIIRCKINLFSIFGIIISPIYHMCWRKNKCKCIVFNNPLIIKNQ